MRLDQPVYFLVALASLAAPHATGGTAAGKAARLSEDGTSPSLGVVPAGTRTERIESHERNPKWKNRPLRIEMSECINCDACLRHCPDQFGAIFNHGVDVIIVPELCSGCDKCLPACPVDCIYPDPEWAPAPDDWWKHPGQPGDPYH